MARAKANGSVIGKNDAVAEAIAAINTEIDATFANTNAGVVTGLVQADGVITSVTQREVKAVDLDESDVFYSGNATGYVEDMNTVNL